MIISELLEKFNLGERHEILKTDKSLHVRPLIASDYGRGYLTLLKQLTEVGDISKEQFLGKQFKTIFIHLLPLHN